MKYSYRVFFSMEDDNTCCRAEIPGLDMSIPVMCEGMKPLQIEHAVKIDLLTTLYVMELDGEELPEDKPCELIGYDWQTVLTVDTTEAPKIVKSVKRIELT